MPTGPPRAPTKIRMMRGTLRADRTNPHEARPIIAAPRCPRELQGEARKFWKRTAPRLIALGLLSEIDEGMFAAYCSAWDRWLTCIERVKQDGLMVISKTRGPILNPLLKEIASCETALRNFGGHFGLSPASRSKVQAIPVAPVMPSASGAEEKYFGRGGKGAA